MARPKAARSGSGKSPLLERVQRQRLDSLRAFAAYLAEPEILLSVVEDDRLFSSTVRLAVSDYGVRQTVLSEKLKVSSAAVSRWMHGSALPSPYVRDKILDALSQIIVENVECQELAARGGEAVMTGNVAAFVH